MRGPKCTVIGETFHRNTSARTVRKLILVSSTLKMHHHSNATLQLPGICPVDSSIRQRPTLLEQKIFHVSQNERGHVRAALGPQAIKLGAFHLVQPERRASVVFDIAH